MMKKPYFLHRELPHKVREYVETHLTVDLNLMTQHIMDNNFQFRNMKFKPFRNSVNTAYEWISYVMEEEKKELENRPIVSDDSSPTGITEENGCNHANDISTLTNGDVQELELSSIPTKKSRDKDAQLDVDIEASIMKKTNTRKVILPTFPAKIVALNELGGIASLLMPLCSVGRTVCEQQSPAVTLLLSGPERCGKTTIVRGMAQMLDLALFEVNVKDILLGGPLSSPTKRVQEELARAHASLPGIILFHKLECLFERDGWLSSRQTDQQAVSSAIHKYIQALSCSFPVTMGSEGRKRAPLLVGETSRPEALDWEFKMIFSEAIMVHAPSVTDKKEMLQNLLCEDSVSPDVDLDIVALKASGFVAGDLERLVKEARSLVKERRAKSDAAALASFDDLIAWIKKADFPAHELLITTEDLMRAAKLVTPSLKRDGFPTIPDTTWADVGGLLSVKENLRNCILDPIKFPALGKGFGLRQNSGILLWGPPGCGKTLLAKAVANEAGINLLIVNGPELLSMYQGESERAVRAVFARAASVAPCVIFFDEFDSLCPRRSRTGVESGSKSTIVNTLLTEMDGFLARPGIYLMAATNLPAILDPAVLRPGRFDTKLYVGLPDAKGRVSVLRAATKNGTLPRLAADVDLDSIASRADCRHFTGADCRNLVDIAIKAAISEYKKNNSETNDEAALKETAQGTDRKRARDDDGDGPCPAKKWKDDGLDWIGLLIEGTEGGEVFPALSSMYPDGSLALYARHFEEALTSVKPSVSEKERAKYEQQLREFQQCSQSDDL